MSDTTTIVVIPAGMYRRGDVIYRIHHDGRVIRVSGNWVEYRPLHRFRVVEFIHHTFERLCWAMRMGRA